MNNIFESEAIRTAEQTREILKEKGWCIWSCRNLDRDKIIVAADGYQMPMMETDYPIYTLSELEELSKKDLSTIKLVHQAKKIGGAKVFKEA
jgi:hypothetical protein